MTPFDNALAVRLAYETNKKKVKTTDLKDALSKMDVTGHGKVKKADCYTALCEIIVLRDGGLTEVVEYAHLEAQYNMMMFPSEPIVEPEVVIEEKPVVEPEPEVVVEPEIVAEPEPVVEKPVQKKKVKSKAKSQKPSLGKALIALLVAQEDGSSFLEKSVLDSLGLNVMMEAEAWGLNPEGTEHASTTVRPNEAQRTLMAKFKTVEVMEDGLYLYGDESGIAPNFRRKPRRYDWSAICTALYNKHRVDGSDKALITKADCEAECGHSKYIRSSSWTDFNDCVNADNGMYKGAGRAGFVGQCLRSGGGDWELFLWPASSDVLPVQEEERAKLKARKEYRERMAAEEESKSEQVAA